MCFSHITCHWCENYFEILDAGLFNAATAAVLCINVAWQKGQTLCQECFLREASHRWASLVNKWHRASLHSVCFGTLWRGASHILLDTSCSLPVARCVPTRDDSSTRARRVHAPLCSVWRLCEKKADEWVLFWPLLDIRGHLVAVQKNRKYNDVRSWKNV